jgi:hypothetical protein
MNKKPLRDSMICPCCGENREISSLECAACGAKQVGPPLAKPDVLMPKLGPSFAALVCGVLVIIVFFLAWIMREDAKVGRVLLVWTLGDGYELTKHLLEAEPRLPYYRIFTFDAYRLAADSFSFVAIPLSIAGVWLARRALRLIKSDSASFAGARVARASYGLSIGLLIVFTAVSVSSIPRAIANGRAKRAAHTRALMYELHARGLQKYYKEYRLYPAELTDLLKVNASGVPQADYWEHNFDYKPGGVIASNGTGVYMTNYKLVSAGPDGIFGTKDDITMVDGVIVESDEPDAAEPNQARQ